MNILSKLILVIQVFVNFPTAIFDRLGLIHGSVLYKTRNNWKFFCRAGTEDMAEVAVVASGSEYLLKKIFLPNNPIIVDIGGHIGTFSILMSKTYNDNCKIFVFEPDRANYNLLVKNIAINKIQSVVSENIAIANYAGRGYLKTENMNTDAYYLDPNAKMKPNVKTNTLHDSLRKYRVTKVDLLKMDIEGGEYGIFEDNKSFNFICRYVHYIFLEYHNIDSYYNEDLIRKIVKGKFNIIQTNKSVLTLVNVNWK